MREKTSSSTRQSSHSLPFLYGYALGEFGFTFFLFFIAYYLLVYMTEVMKIPTELAAILYTVVQWFEVITMIWAGFIIDSGKSTKGKYGPWLIRGSGLLLICMTLLFLNPKLPTVGKMVWFLLFYLLTYMGYNLMWVAYRTLLGPLSRNAKDSIYLTSSSAQMGSVAGLCYSFVSMHLLNAFSDRGTGFTVAAACFGLICLICMLIVGKLAAPFEQDYQPAQKAQKAVSLHEMFSVFSPPMIAFFLAVSFREAASTILPTLMVYYFTYVLLSPNLMTLYLSVITISGIIGHFFARKLADRFGKKQMFIWASLCSCVCILMIRGVGTSTIAFMTLMGLNAFFGIFSGAMIPAFITEIADYNESTRNVHARAFTSSVGGTALRFAQIIGGGLASFGLAFIGYSSGMEATPKIISGITNLMVYGCSTVILISVIIMSMYQIKAVPAKTR